MSSEERKIASAELAGYFGGIIPEVAYDYIRLSDETPNRQREVLAFMGRAFDAGSYQVQVTMRTEEASLKSRVALLEKREERRGKDLYQMQWRSAEGGSDEMMIWLGRQELGQTDNPGPVSTSKSVLQARALRGSGVS